MAVVAPCGWQVVPISVVRGGRELGCAGRPRGAFVGKYRTPEKPGKVVELAVLPREISPPAPVTATEGCGARL